MLMCPNCNSEDYDIMDEEYNLPEGWAEFKVECNECHCDFKVCATIKIDDIEVIARNG